MFRRSVGDTSKQPYFHLSACRRSSGAGIQSAIQGEWVFTRRIEDCAKPPAPGVSQAALRTWLQCHVESHISTRLGATAPRSVVAEVERQQFAEGVVVADVGRPPVGGSDSSIERRVCVGQPLRPGVVEVRESALLEGFGGVLVAGNRSLRISRYRLVHPLDPFRRVEPAFRQFDEPLGDPSDVDRPRIGRGGWDVRRESGRERERLEGGASACSADGFPGSFGPGVTRFPETGCG